MSDFFFADATSARWLIDRVSRLDTTETSHVPTADRVARLFHQAGEGTSVASGSDSESEDALEEIDFADMAQVRAEVEAIARATATATMDRDTQEDEEDIEEVDFADLGALRARVDAAEPKAPSRDGIVQEAFTGVYNQVKNTTQVSSTTDVVAGVQRTAPFSVSPSLNDSLNLKPISNLSNHESFMHDRVTIVVEGEVPREEAPCSLNALPNMPIEAPSLSTAPETHLHPDAYSYDDPHPLFVIDTAPMHPFSGRSASDDILVDRTGHGETLGDQDDEQIVYVAPHPRLRSASPVPAVPRVKLPRSSVLTGRSVEVTSSVREDGGSTMPDRDRDRMRASLEVAGEEYHLSLASLTLGPSTLNPSTFPPTHPLGTTERKARKKKARLHRQRQRHNKRSGLGFDAHALMSEAMLKEEDAKEKRRPRWESRRRGDSDVDWGTEGEGQDREGDEVDAVSDGLGGMEIDPDLDVGVDAMYGFLKSMSAEGSRFVTMDDIEDEARMRREDEEDEGGPDGSSDSEHGDGVDVDEEEEEEEEEVFNIEEEILIAESEGDEELSEDSDDEDDELSPRSGFQARLHRLREQSRNQRPKAVQETSDDEEDAPEFPPRTRSAEDEEFIAHINVSRESTVIECVSHADVG